MADFMYRCDLTKKLEKMWNSQKFSDTLFRVNNSKFHASSHLVSASSDVLHSLLDTHYQNCDDREITMGGIKNDESFLVILKCIYGIELNLTQMGKAVMCEVLRLCETYGLTDFSNTIKCFLATLDCFQLDSLVILLNTAKKFSLKELYEKLSVFAFHNADQLLKHKSFAELQFDVLRDLLKSDCFFASEIDILTGALIWHSDNMNQSPSNAAKILDMKNDNSCVAEDAEDSSDSQLNVDEIDLTETIDSNLSNERKNEKIVSIKSAGSPSVSFNKINLNAETLSQTDSCAELVKTFSDNVLKTLLSHIRMKQISFFESVEVFETELFSRYKVFLTGTSSMKYMSKINQPRVKYMSKIKEPSVKYAPVAVAPILHDITKKYTVELFDCNNINESSEKYLIGDMEWKVGLNYRSIFEMLIYLKCISTKQRDWECTTECQFKIIPRKPGYHPLVLPEDGSYKSVTLTSDNSCVEVCRYNFTNLYKPNTWFKVFVELRHNCYVFPVDVHFKSIHIKTK